MPNALPSVEYLEQCFAYDSETGVLRWLHRPREHFRSPWSYAQFFKNVAGTPAGNVAKHGYISIGLDGRRLYAHRVIWKMVTGEEPPAIDHRDGDGLNNRWDNLRRATQSENLRNANTGFASLYGLPKGVTFDKARGLFIAQISVNNRCKHLGRFGTVEEAAAAYAVAAGEFFKPR
jgi:hypothetical protein